MDWFSHSRLFELARQGKRLTHGLAVIPLAILFLFLSEFGAIPVVVAQVIQYGFSENMPLAPGMSATTSGIWMALFLVSAFFLIYGLAGLWAYFFEKRPFWTIGYETKNARMRYGRGFLAGALLFGGAVGILSIFGTVTFKAGDPAQQGAAALGGMLIVLTGWVAQGGAEEIITRGWILPVLGARYRPWVGLDETCVRADAGVASRAGEVG
jgi:membrane protease YdiL (CAAX protease family)